jgi:arginase family enzyme
VVVAPAQAAAAAERGLSLAGVPPATLGGPTSFEALKLLRACAGLPFVGFDVVEVAASYDGPGQITALFAANAIFETLTLVTMATAS